MAEVKLRSLTKVFPDGTVALKDIDLTIADGELLAVLGPSGCGKSTLLKILAGLDAPTSGDITFDGRSVTGLEPGERNVAMVFQNYALYPHMTVRDNLAFPLRMSGHARKDVAARVDVASQRLGLQSLLDRKPRQLSGGQAQRVAMGRAIVRDPALFLMDEPLSNLDAKLRVEVRSVITDLQRSLSTTTVYVTHDQVEALTLGERVAVLQSGHLLQIDTPNALYERPANMFVAGFLGNPGMNLFKADVMHKGDHVSLKLGPHELILPSQSTPPANHEPPQFAGIRPESFLLPVDGITLPRIRARIEAVEVLGRDQLLYFKAGAAMADMSAVDLGREPGLLQPEAGRMTARVSGQIRVSTGSSMELAVDVRDLHWFDHVGGLIR